MLVQIGTWTLAYFSLQPDATALSLEAWHALAWSWNPCLLFTAIWHRCSALLSRERISMIMECSFLELLWIVTTTLYPGLEQAAKNRWILNWRSKSLIFPIFSWYFLILDFFCCCSSSAYWIMNSIVGTFNGLILKCLIFLLLVIDVAAVVIAFIIICSCIMSLPFVITVGYLHFLTCCLC